MSGTDDGFLAAAGQGSTGWSCVITDSSIKKELSGGIHTLTPKPEYIILTMVGEFECDDEVPSGAIESIALWSPAHKEWKRLAAIGVIGKNGQCSYAFPSGFTGSIGISNDQSPVLRMALQYCHAETFLSTLSQTT